MYQVYIIYSEKLNRFYVGHSADVEKRLAEHNDGVSTYTARARDWQLRYCEVFKTREEARGRELEIKRKKSRKYIESLISGEGK